MNIFLTLGGIILSTTGSVVIGINDLMNEDKAIDLIAHTLMPESREERLKHPFVRELLKRSERTSIGLAFVVMGSLYLILAALK